MATVQAGMANNIESDDIQHDLPRAALAALKQPRNDTALDAFLPIIPDLKTSWYIRASLRASLCDAIKTLEEDVTDTPTYRDPTHVLALIHECISDLEHAYDRIYRVYKE